MPPCSQTLHLAGVARTLSDNAPPPAIWAKEKEMKHIQERRAVAQAHTFDRPLPIAKLAHSRSAGVTPMLIGRAGREGKRVSQSRAT